MNARTGANSWTVRFTCCIKGDIRAPQGRQNLEPAAPAPRRIVNAKSFDRDRRPGDDRYGVSLSPDRAEAMTLPAPCRHAERSAGAEPRPRKSYHRVCSRRCGYYGCYTRCWRAGRIRLLPALPVSLPSLLIDRRFHRRRAPLGRPGLPTAARIAARRLPFSTLVLPLFLLTSASRPHRRLRCGRVGCRKPESGDRSGTPGTTVTNIAAAMHAKDIPARVLRKEQRRSR